MHKNSLYWFTLSPSRNTLLLAQQSTEIRIASDSTLTPNYRNTVIKEEDNRIHLSITKLKDQKYTPILFHTLENPKLEVNLENLKFNLHYDSSKLFFLLFRSV